MPAFTSPTNVSVKVTPPTLRPDDVRRPQLVAQLPGGNEDSPLTLLVAPGGCGKSTLLADWVAATGDDHRIAWVSLEPADNDPARFVNALASAIATAIPEAPVPEQRNPVFQQPALWLDTAASATLHAISSQRGPATLVLDDYHLITDPELHNIVAVLLDQLPPNAKLVVSSRTDPPLRLAKLRLEGKVEEIRHTELAFDVEQTAELLQVRFGLELSASDLEILVKRTEGWAAGIALAAISMGTTDDPSEFVANFAGDDRHVVDYLGEEVLDRVRPELRRFLLRTSILERVSSGLAEALVGPDGPQLLDEAVERNLFLIPLDTKRMAFRYHHLFSERMRTELRYIDPERMLDLYRRAAEWCAENHEIRNAVEYALASGDYPLAIDLIATKAYPLVMDRGRYATVLRWIETIPEEHRRERPEIYLHAAQATLLGGGAAADQELWLDRFAASAPDPEPEQEIGYLVQRGWWANTTGDAGGVLEWMKQAEARLESMWHEPAAPSHVGEDVLEVIVSIGVAHYFVSDLDTALEYAELGLARSSAESSLGPILGSRALRDVVRFDRGDTDAALAGAEESLRIAEERSFPDSVYVLASVLLAAHAADEVERSDLLARARRILERELAPTFNAWAAAMEAEILARNGEMEDAAEALDTAHDYLSRSRGASQIAEAVDRAASIVEARSGRAAPDPDALSPRQIQILRALAGPLTQREIGRELYLSFNTVKAYVRDAYRKLGVGSRSEAVARARDLNII